MVLVSRPLTGEMFGPWHRLVPRRHGDPGRLPGSPWRRRPAGL